jgi:hypothetical protein
LPDFYSGCAIGISGRLTEGLLLWRSHRRRGNDFQLFGQWFLGVELLYVGQKIERESNCDTLLF